jgi:hypothetical protein
MKRQLDDIRRFDLVDSVMFTNQTLPKSPPTPLNIKENDVVTIICNEADNMRLVPLFFRKHLVDQLVKVDQFGKMKPNGNSM